MLVVRFFFIFSKGESGACNYIKKNSRKVDDGGLWGYPIPKYHEKY